jgi:hypothetical protein
VLFAGARKANELLGRIQGAASDYWQWVGLLSWAGGAVHLLSGGGDDLWRVEPGWCSAGYGRKEPCRYWYAAGVNWARRTFVRVDPIAEALALPARDGYGDRSRIGGGPQMKVCVVGLGYIGLPTASVLPIPVTR